MAALKCGHAKALVSLSVDELSEKIITDSYMAGLMSSGAPARGRAHARSCSRPPLMPTGRKARILGRLCSVEYSTEQANA